jgi:hypothetical protein
VAAPGIQYTWDYGSNPPRVVVIDSSYFPEGELIDLSFLYLDKASRNNPSQGVYSRVDVWCAGQRPKNAATTVALSNAITFQSSTSSTWYAGSFTRPDSSPPVAGNIFVPLPYGPVLTVPSTLVVGGTTYGLASATNPMGTTSGGVTYAYQIVHRAGAFGWSPYSDFGLEWQAGNYPGNGQALVLSEDYTYNDVPYSIQQSLENWRLAGTDVQAHQGVQAFLRFSLGIIYDLAVSQSVTQAAINTALSTYLSQLGFNSRVYPSSVLQVVENTPGVVASRFLVGSDYPGYNPATPSNYNVGIQQTYAGVVIKSFVDSGGNPVDIEFGDDTIPTFGDTQLVTKAANTMGSFA